MRIKLLIAISISLAAFAQGPQVNWNSQIRNMPVVDVRSPQGGSAGAKCDGSTDDTAAIQRSVNTAEALATATGSGGAKVLLCAGVSIIGGSSSVATPIVINRPISFVGLGPSQSILRRNGAVTSGTLIAAQMQYVVTGATCASGTFVFTIGANTLGVGQVISTSGIAPSGYNLNAQTITAVSSTTFTVAPGGSCPGSYTTSGVAFLDTPAAHLDIGDFRIDMVTQDTTTTGFAGLFMSNPRIHRLVTTYGGYGANIQNSCNVWVTDDSVFESFGVDGILWTQDLTPSNGNVPCAGENHIVDTEFRNPGASFAKAALEVIRSTNNIDTGAIYLNNVHANGFTGLAYGLLTNDTVGGFVIPFLMDSKIDGVGTNILISNASWTSTAGGTLTVTTAYPHPYQVGWPVAVWGIHDAGADGKFNAACAIATVPSSTSFTCTGITNPGSAFSAGTSASVTAASCSSGNATYTVSGTYTVGQVVQITGITPSGYNQNNATVTTGGTGSFHAALTCPGSYTSGGTVYSGTNWGFVSTAPTHIRANDIFYAANNWISTALPNQYTNGAGPAIILDGSYLTEMTHDYITCCGSNGQNGYAIGLFNGATQVWLSLEQIEGRGYYFGVDNNNPPSGVDLIGPHAQISGSLQIANSLDLASMSTGLNNGLDAPLYTGMNILTSNSTAGPGGTVTLTDAPTGSTTNFRETNGVQLGVTTWPGIEFADLNGGHVLFDIFNNGWIWIGGVALTDSALSSCGTSPHIFGSVAKGFINVGSGATACTVTWASGGGTAPPFAPICMVSGAGSPFVSSASTSALTIGGGSGIASTRVNYLCVE